MEWIVSLWRGASGQDHRRTSLKLIRIIIHNGSTIVIHVTNIVCYDVLPKTWQKRRGTNISNNGKFTVGATYAEITTVVSQYKVEGEASGHHFTSNGTVSCSCCGELTRFRTSCGSRIFHIWDSHSLDTHHYLRRRSLRHVRNRLAMMNCTKVHSEKHCTEDDSRINENCTFRQCHNSSSHQSTVAE